MWVEVHTIVETKPNTEITQFDGKPLMHGRQVTLDSSLRKTEERGMSPWNSGRGGGGVRTRSYTPDLSASGVGGGRGRYLYS